MKRNMLRKKFRTMRRRVAASFCQKRRRIPTILVDKLFPRAVRFLGQPFMTAFILSTPLKEF